MLTCAALPGGPDFNPIEEIREGRADIALAEGVYVASAIEAGHDLTIIGNFFQRSALVIAGIKKYETLEALQGKRVGVWCCGYDYPVKMMLWKAGIDVEYVDQSFSMNQLYAGDIDLASAMGYNKLALLLEKVDPDTNFLRQLSDVSVFDPSAVGMPYMHNVVIVRTSRLQELAGQLVRALRVVICTWVFVGTTHLLVRTRTQDRMPTTIGR